MNETYQFRLFPIHSALFIRLALLEKEKENVNYILKSKTQNEQNLHSMLVHLTSSSFGFVHSFGLIKKRKENINYVLLK